MVFRINDLDTLLDDPDKYNIYHEGAQDYFEHIVIENNDINYKTDLLALGRGILAVFKTRIGEIDGVGMEKFGCRLLELRGQPVNNLTTDLIKVYIEETLPQFGKRVLRFSIIDVLQINRRRILIHVRAETIFGNIDITHAM